MARTIKIDPLTRIEGHLAFRIEVKASRVVDAFCSGEMFRGFEVLLKGRNPMDAQQITQRICGICPISHATASVQAQEDAYALIIPPNARLLRNLTLAANYLMSHITHFYHLSALDFLDIAAVTNYSGNDPLLNHLKYWVLAQSRSQSLFPAAPFLPRYEGRYLDEPDMNIPAIRHYMEALDIRMLCHKMAAVFGGKLPHSPVFVPGGMTQKPTVDTILKYAALLKNVGNFIQQAYLPDVLNVARSFPEYWNIGRGCENFLSYGVFQESERSTDLLFPAGVSIGSALSELHIDAISEDVKFSLFSSDSGLHPSKSRTIPAPEKQDAYSWIKAPRYQGHVMEVGPLARMIIATKHDPASLPGRLLTKTLRTLNKTREDLPSVMGRHLTRALECSVLAERCAEWVEQLIPDDPTAQDFNPPKAGMGVGLTEAPRGALGHWLEIQDGRIERYQCVVPTSWNCSPRDDQGERGAVEQALIGTPIRDDAHPLEAARVVRAFDPCIACAVH